MIHSITYQAGTARRRGGWLLRSRREHENDLRIVDVDSGGAGGNRVLDDWPGGVSWPGLVAWRATENGVHLLLTASAPTPRGADPRFDRLAAARGYYDEWISETLAAGSAVEHPVLSAAAERWLAAHAFGLRTTGQRSKPSSAPLRGRS